MDWTTDKPTQAGLYQYRPLHSLMIVFYQVERMNGELMVIRDGNYWEMEELPGQWRGPILDASPWR